MQDLPFFSNSESSDSRPRSRLSGSAAVNNYLITDFDQLHLSDGAFTQPPILPRTACEDGGAESRQADDEVKYLLGLMRVKLKGASKLLVSATTALQQVQIEKADLISQSRKERKKLHRELSRVNYVNALLVREDRDLRRQLGDKLKRQNTYRGRNEYLSPQWQSSPPPSYASARHGAQNQQYKSRHQQGKTTCPNCGLEKHERHAICKAFGQQCYRCHKFNHFGRVCRQGHGSAIANI